jgi:hypothetical protein
VPDILPKEKESTAHTCDLESRMLLQSSTVRSYANNDYYTTENKLMLEN